MWHEALRARVGAGRLAHCERTAALCRSWAADHPDAGVPPDRAWLAGLLHDFGRSVGDPQTMLAEAGRFGIPVSEIARAFPVFLLHAPVGAALLREAGLRDEEVLAAVAFHTVGRAGMMPLEALVYTADYCEPGRTHEGAEAVREALLRDLWLGALEATRGTLRHLVAIGRPIDAETLKTWNDLVGTMGR